MASVIAAMMRGKAFIPASCLSLVGAGISRLAEAMW
jgi:hypothetical protein